MSLIASTQYYIANTFTQEFQLLFFFYLAWATAHHVSPHLYTYFCTPNTLFGVLASPFMATAPHCSGLRWVIYEGGNTINMMWISFAGYSTSKIMFRNKI